MSLVGFAVKYLSCYDPNWVKPLHTGLKKTTADRGEQAESLHAYA